MANKNAIPQTNLRWFGSGGVRSSPQPTALRQFTLRSLATRHPGIPEIRPKAIATEALAIATTTPIAAVTEGGAESPRPG